MNSHHDLAPEPDKKLTSDRLDDFREALEVLYVIANLSGRLQFVQRWPEAGEYVLGAQLIAFDRDGATDRVLRAALEIEAEERRLAFLDVLDTLEDKSVHKGALQLEYVEALVKELGRPLALCLYADRIVDRFIAPPPPPVEEIEEEVIAAPVVDVKKTYVPPVIPVVQIPVVGEAPHDADAEEEEFVSHFEEDPLSIVQPISVSAPLPVKPAPLLDVPEEEKTVIAVPPAPMQTPAEEEDKPATTQSVSMTFISSKKKPPDDESSGGSDTKH